MITTEIRESLKTLLSGLQVGAVNDQIIFTKTVKEFMEKFGDTERTSTLQEVKGWFIACTDMSVARKKHIDNTYKWVITGCVGLQEGSENAILEMAEVVADALCEHPLLSASGKCRAYIMSVSIPVRITVEEISGLLCHVARLSFETGYRYAE